MVQLNDKTEIKKEKLETQSCHIQKEYDFLNEIDFPLAPIFCNLDDFVPAMLNSTYIPSKKSKVEAYS